MSNNQNRYFHYDRSTSTNQSFALLDTVQDDNKTETGELMNDSNMEFIALEELELTGNPDKANVLTPEANVHVNRH